MYKPTNIMPAETIAELCAKIQSFCEAEYNADVPAAVIDRAVELEGYMATSGKMVADAKWHYNDVLNGVFMASLKEANQASMSPSTINKYIDSVCKDFQYLCDWTERINRTCTHQLDFCRSMVSKHKEEFKAATYSGARA